MQARSGCGLELLQSVIQIEYLPTIQFSFGAELNPVVQTSRMILWKDCKYIFEVKYNPRACLRTAKLAWLTSSTELIIRGSQTILQSTGHDVQLLQKADKYSPI